VTDSGEHLDELIGRDDDLAGLLAIVRPGTITTISGVGGVGKTAIAEVLMAAVADRFDDRWMCELAAVFDADSVESAIEDTIGALPHEDGTSIDALISVLRGRSALLVLDNVEQVVGATARLCTKLLAACPDLCIVATSRELLRVVGEQVWTLDPLNLDGEARELFARRAVLVDPEFDPVKHVDQIDHVCTALDGLPLALELAAAQLATMSVTDLAGRLDQRFRILRDSERTDRQATLGATVRWSYDLLGAAERRLFDRLSVFHGGFDAVAARDVLDPSDRDLEVGHMLELLADRSMVARSKRHRGRYEVLESLRHFGDRQLADRGERSSARSAHLDHVVSLVGEASARCHGSDWRRGVERFTVEWDNIRAAMNWAIDLQRTGDVDRLLRDLFFMSRWTVETEPAAWSIRAIERGEATDLPVGAPAHLHLAFARFLAGDHEGALAANQDALTHRPTPSDRGWARHYGAVELLYQGRTAEAAQLADAMMIDVPPRPVEQAMQLSAGAVFKLYAQHISYDDAVESNDRAADIARESGSPVALGHVTYNQGLVAYTRGDVEHARARFAEALEIARSEQIANLTGYVLVSQVYAPGYSGLAAAQGALAYWQRHQDVGNEFVVLEAAAINLAEIGRLESAGVILGNLDQDPRRIASSKPRREAAAGEIALHRRADQWRQRGVEMTRLQLLAYADEAISDALKSL
jgi:predicted ATPase